MKKFIISYVLISAFLYALLSFYALSFNPVVWSETERALYVVLLALSGIILFMYIIGD